jgi:hypothetical protein
MEHLCSDFPGKGEFHNVALRNEDGESTRFQAMNGKTWHDVSRADKNWESRIKDTSPEPIDQPIQSWPLA